MAIRRWLPQLDINREFNEDITGLALEEALAARSVLVRTIALIMKRVLPNADESQIVRCMLVSTCLKLPINPFPHCDSRTHDPYLEGLKEEMGGTLQFVDTFQ